MKKLLILVVCVFFTYTTFGQTEREQKISKIKTNTSTNTGGNNNGGSNTGNNGNGYNHGYNHGYNQGFLNANQNFYYYNPNRIGVNPYWNTNRVWDGRTYVMTNDDNLIKKNKSEPIRLNMGVLFETDFSTYTYSPYLAIGREGFLLLQYHVSQVNDYPYYSNIETYEVIDWGDEFNKTIVERREFSIGYGKSVDRFSPFVMIGFPKVTTYDSYYDEFFVLSPESQDGIYSINKRITNPVSLRFGTFYSFRNLDFVTQIRYDGNFAVGIGLGFKL